MKKILYSLFFIAATLLSACKDDLPQANFDLYQVEKVTPQIGDGQVVINWTPIEGSNPQEYFIVWTCSNPEIKGGDMTVDPSVTSITINNLVNDASYKVSVQARYPQGISGRVSVNVTPKNSRFPVADFIAAAGDQKVRLKWTKPASDNLIKYQIAYLPGGGMIDIDDPMTQSYVVTGLTNNTEYSFSITCVYPNGLSEAEVALATPGDVSPIVVANTSVVKNQPAKFTYNDMYFVMGEVQSVSWDFGDGTTTNVVEPTHSFTTEGKYNVTVTVTYTDNTTEEGVIEITVTNYLWSQKVLSFGTRPVGLVKCSNPVFSPDGKVMYVTTSGTATGDMYAIDMASGIIKWVFELPLTYGGGAVVGNDGTIYQATAASSGNKVYAINPDGTQKWEFSISGAVGAFPAYNNNTLYVLANGAPCQLYAINATTGSAVWSSPVNVDGGTGGAVAVTKTGDIIVGTYTQVAAFSPTGSPLWNIQDLAITERGSFAFGGVNKLYATLRGTSPVKAGLVQIDITQGKLDWTFETSVTSGNGDCYFPIVDKNGVIYFAQRGTSTTTGNNIYAVNPNGTQKWVQNIGMNMIYTGLALSEAGVVYGATQANVSGNWKRFGLDTNNNGAFVMNDNLSEQVMSAVTIGPDKRLYIGTINTATGGSIWAFDINSSAQQNCWSIRGGDLQGTNKQK